MTDYRLEDLIDIPLFQELQDKLNAVYDFPSAIIDNEGKVLTATAWQDICVKFHRGHPECLKECVKSDQYILAHIHEANPAVTYKCPHGLVDNATPIIIDGKHLGNYFTGQFFLEPPDLDFFRAQAKRYGFDEEKYLEAVRRVPVWSREKLDKYLEFIKGFTEIIAGIGYKNLREAGARRELQLRENALADSEKLYRTLFEQSGDYILVLGLDESGVPVIIDANEAALRAHGYSREELVGRPLAHLDPDFKPEDFRRRISGDGSPARGTLEVKHRRKDGTEFEVELRYQVLEIGGRRVVQSSERDITERKRSQALQAARLRLLEFASGSTMDDFLEETLNQAELLTGSKIGFYTFVTDDQQKVSLQNWSTNTKAHYCRAAGKGLHYDISKAGVWVECFHKRAPVIHNDYNSQPGRKGLPEGHAPLHRELTVPVMRGGKVKAIVAVGNKPSDYTPEDVAVFASLADLAWDIVERKAAEERLLASLAEKEVLLKEIHHRVKNNLQVVSSLLNLQAKRVDDEGALSALKESRSRVMAMALVHDTLYRTQDFGNLNIRAYVGRLTEAMMDLNKAAGRVELLSDICDQPLSADTAVPLGLILNELLSNAFKHAFTDGRAGRLSVSLKKEADGRFLLEVADDGPGLPPGQDMRARSTLGLQLVHTLAGQIHGTVESSSGRGARVILRFADLGVAQ